MDHVLPPNLPTVKGLPPTEEIRPSLLQRMCPGSTSLLERLSTPTLSAASNRLSTTVTPEKSPSPLPIEESKTSSNTTPSLKARMMKRRRSSSPTVDLSPPSKRSLLARMSEENPAIHHPNPTRESLLNRISSHGSTATTNLKMPSDLALIPTKLIPTMMTTPSRQASDASLANEICPGIARIESCKYSSPPAATRHAAFSESTDVISRNPSVSSSRLLADPQGSPCLSGSTSLTGDPSTSTSSSATSIERNLLQRTLDAWDSMRSSLESLNHAARSNQLLTGGLPGMLPPKQSNSLSRTGRKNYASTGNISKIFSNQSQTRHTPESSATTSPSETRSAVATSSYSLTGPTFPTSTKPLLRPMVESQRALGNASGTNPLLHHHPSQQFVTDSTLPVDVRTKQPNANTGTSARNASPQATPKPSAPKPANNGLRGLHPSYLRYAWGDYGEWDTRTIAEWSETAAPLPSIPEHELANPMVQETIASLPGVFKVNTPININAFEAMLRTHPNQPFVKSVVKGLREGFWPWADTKLGTYPDMHHEDRGLPRDPAKRSFLEAQRQEERDCGRYSEPFGHELKPGMYCMPQHAVPKSDMPGDYRLVSDQSAGKWSVNSMIDDNSVRGYPLDNLNHLGDTLLVRKRDFPNEEVVLFKSDITGAYRLLPMHVCWQIKQIVHGEEGFQGD